MKTLAAPAKPSGKRRASKWIPGGASQVAISKFEADRFTEGLLEIASRLEGLPRDLAQNHDHYLHGLPKK